MGYTYKKEDEFKLLEEGDYEVRIENCEFAETQNGTDYIKITLRIRDDIEQPSKNRSFSDSIWKEKDHPEYFNRQKINRILGALNVADGTEFNTIEDVMKEIKGSFIIAHVVKRHDEYYGKEVNSVRYYKPTKFNGELKSDISKASNEDLIEITEDDLPF